MDMEYLLEMCHEDEEFLRDFMAQPSSVAAGAAAAATNELPELLPPSTSSRACCIISMGNSTTIPLPAMISKSKPPRCPTKKRSSENLNLEPKAITRKGEKKKNRTLHHAIGERKRRLELAHKFVELSTIIPRVKKTDKASILVGTINYVEQLRKRVMGLEQQNKKGKEPMTFLNSETNVDNCLRPKELVPDVKVKVLEKNVLIYINCEKENGIELKILDMLQNLHLFVTSTSILPFGNSTLGITITAKMEDAFKLTMVDDLVDNVRQLLLDGKNRQT